MTPRAEAKSNRLRAWSRFLENRNEKTQVALVESYRSMVEGMAQNDYGWRRDIEDIKDIAMLGVLEATEKMDTFRVKNVDAYVALVCRSRMINYLQKMMHRDVPMPNYTIMQEMEDALWRNVELEMDVEARMEKLTEKEQKVLRLRFWEGLYQKDVAKILKCSKQSVFTNERSALAKMKSAIL